MPCLRMNTEESRDVKRTDADDKPQVRDSATPKNRWGRRASRAAKAPRWRVGLPRLGGDMDQFSEAWAAAGAALKTGDLHADLTSVKWGLAAFLGGKEPGRDGKVLVKLREIID